MGFLLLSETEEAFVERLLTNVCSQEETYTPTCLGLAKSILHKIAQNKHPRSLKHVKERHNGHYAKIPYKYLKIL